MRNFYQLFLVLFFLVIISGKVYSQCSGCSPLITTNQGSITTSGTTTCITASSGDITITSLTIAASTTLCVDASAGNITFGSLDLGKSATLNIYSSTTNTVVITNYSEGAGTNPRFINNNGNLRVDANAAGSVVSGWRVFRAVVNNSGTINVTNGLEAGGNSSWTNSGTINVGAGVQSNGATWVNSGTLNITGNFGSSSATTFTNTGTFGTTGNNTVNYNLTNGGRMDVGGLLTINASGALNFQGGRVYTYDLLLNAGTMNTGTGCAAIVVTNHSDANANGFMVGTGSVDVTDLSQSSGTPNLDANTCPGPTFTCGLTFSTSTASNTCLNPSSLPVNLITFKGKYLSESEVELEWETASETNNKFFIVERTEDLNSFSQVATVNAIGNSNEKATYLAVDNYSSNEDVFYRLSQKDIDGTTRALGIIMPDRPDGEFTVNVYPNPNKGQFTVACFGKYEIRHIHLLDQTGKVVYVVEDFANKLDKTFNLNLEGLKGMYILSVATDEDITFTKVNIE